MPTRRTFALGLGTVLALPRLAVGGAPAVVGRLRVRAHPDRLTLSLYLRAEESIEVAIESGGKPWHPFQPVLSWSEAGSAPLVPRGELGNAMRSGPSAWQPLPAGIEVPYPSFTYDWPDGVVQGTQVELRTAASLITDRGPVQLALPALRFPARTVHDSGS